MLRLDDSIVDSASLLRAMDSLSVNASWAIIRKWIDANMEREAYQFSPSDIETRWREGGLMALKELMSYIDTSGSVSKDIGKEPINMVVD